jgi:hypothetical protein
MPTGHAFAYVPLNTYFDPSNYSTAIYPNDTLYVNQYSDSIHFRPIGHEIQASTPEPYRCSRLFASLLSPKWDQE